MAKARKRTQSEFIGIRVTPDEREKIRQLSNATAKPGNLTAGLRLAIALAEEPSAAGSSSAARPAHERQP